jgi:hypothetical protein
MWKRLRSPSGVKRGSRKHDSPDSVWARIRNASDIGAEQNHLCPVTSQSPSGRSRASVVLARTSEPPWRSVIAIPQIAPRFCSDGIMRGSYSSDVKRGSHSAATSGDLRSAGIAA